MNTRELHTALLDDLEGLFKDRTFKTPHNTMETPKTYPQELPPEESVWQKRVAADLDFNPEQGYPASFMALDLAEDTDDPQWQHFTREDLIRKDQEGHQSLRNQYETKSTICSTEPENQ